MKFFEELHLQRWDDHRFYHQNRINQTLHFFSACCFLSSYVLIFIDPVLAVMVAWLLAMVLRQSGHFFFESKEFDTINNCTNEYKESVKVGYNISRKIVLLSIWAAIPFIYYFDVHILGIMKVENGMLYNISVTWLWLGLGAVLFRTLHLFKIKGVQSGIVWATKILTDPFHDVKIYWRAPYRLLKGDMIDDMTEWYREKPATNA